MKARTLITFTLLLFSTLCALAQNSIHITVTDRDSHEAVIGATILTQPAKKVIAVTDINGKAEVKAATGSILMISSLGYKKATVKIGAQDINVSLQPEINTIGEVVVTAQESRGLAATSIINKHAMEHLQPSSFADILELLPGGRAKDPSLTTPNTIHLREATDARGQYSTSALGTSFVVDGAPINTNANRQYLTGSWDNASTSREFVNQGVDMRSISTDDIEKVEIVRGIPSVEYGELTSGLVKIERRRGGHDLSARLKADMGSKLVYIAKGFEWEPRKLSLNISADYLDAKDDPRNRLENYKRLTLSARVNKEWANERFTSNLSTNIDYTGSFDDDKTDPNINKQAEDKYSSMYSRIAFMAKYNLKSKHEGWFDSFNATFSTDYSHDLIDRTALVQLSRLTPAPTTTVTGESDAYILPYKYTANHKVDGKPFNAYAKLNVKLRIPSKLIANTLLLGTDWTMSKNYGRGQMYDPTRPLYASSALARPRALSAVPAEHNLAFYAEEHMNVPLWGNELEIVGGIRATELLNLDGKYAMHGHLYFDPRMNVGWTFKKFMVGKLPTFIRIAYGIGEHTKSPTMEQLYPDPQYLDLIQLNYFSSNPDHRRINLMTYVIDPTNYDLKPARNFKWELSTDINVGGNRLSVTYFREDMKSGFRGQTSYAPYTYKRYDSSGIDDSSLDGQPSLEGMPYTIQKELYGYSYYSNGSRTLKEGIEYTLSTRRWEAIHTRLTINGAWFHTTYTNSVVDTYRPSVVIDNKTLQLVGYYAHTGGYENQSLNTNFTVDTDIPKLRLGFSLSAQCLWFTMNQMKQVSNYPDYYMDGDGVQHDWQDGDENDTYLRHLVRLYSDSQYAKNRVPFSMNLNFKVTKKLFGNRVNVALFCNKILDYTPDYDSNGTTIRRHVTPYFGLETNFKI